MDSFGRFPPVETPKIRVPIRKHTEVDPVPFITEVCIQMHRPYSYTHPWGIQFTVIAEREGFPTRQSWVGITPTRDDGGTQFLVLNSPLTFREDEVGTWKIKFLAKFPAKPNPEFEVDAGEVQVHPRGAITWEAEHGPWLSEYIPAKYTSLPMNGL